MRQWVTAVGSSATHRFSKSPRESITLRTGTGVEGDAHQGRTVRHRSRVARDPSAPNLRQVHLIHRELFDRLAAAGRQVRPGDLGENVTTSGIELLDLPTGTRLLLGEHALIEITGLRNPCQQIDAFQPGLLKELLGRDDQGELVRLAGVMAVVLADGVVRPGDPIEVRLPAAPHAPLIPV
ncbi:MOSC domain-containing protein [Actinoalloteichus hoggarensis]|uniref:MOSC domain protein n=2 Tax=Actinoalloteichus hoggarensis TaxID=1470176 RepID=A0A221W2T5_9PSEU|nr:MOSC domain-containing protein [Actinoalloteichus hoggarensis]ASO20036.1 MOSC domain protein [Actinoalloteichus hoggarensis]